MVAGATEMEKESGSFHCSGQIVKIGGFAGKITCKSMRGCVQIKLDFQDKCSLLTLDKDVQPLRNSLSLLAVEMPGPYSHIPTFARLTRS